MNNLLIFFVLPVATIILSVVLQRIIRCPILVAATAFAIYLIVTYTAFDSSFLIFVILYTILAFLSAFIAQLIWRYNNSNNSNFSFNCARDTNINTNGQSLENNFNNSGSLLGTNNDYNFYDGMNYGSNSNYNGLNNANMYRCKKRF